MAAPSSTYTYQKELFLLFEDGGAIQIMEFDTAQRKVSQLHRHGNAFHKNK